MIIILIIVIVASMLMLCVAGVLILGLIVPSVSYIQPTTEQLLDKLNYETVKYATFKKTQNEIKKILDRNNKEYYMSPELINNEEYARFQTVIVDSISLTSNCCNNIGNTVIYNYKCIYKLVNFEEDGANLPVFCIKYMTNQELATIE